MLDISNIDSFDKASGKTMNSAIDHRLLRVLCAVVETESVSRAAGQLGITQPTASYLLARLRTRLTDPLFVKTDGRMKPTPKTLALYRDIRKGLDILDAAFDPTIFEPARSDRVFRLAMSDIGELVFLPPLLRAVEAVAPGIVVESVQAPFDELARLMNVGDVDFAIGNLPELLSATSHRNLFREHYVGILQRKHPFAGRKLTLKAMETLDHVVITSPFAGHHVIERRLREACLARKPRAAIQSFAGVPAVVANTNLLAIAPSRVAKAYGESHGLRAVALPVAVSPIEVRLHWSARHENNAAHVWMRGVLLDSLSRL
jgi:DNA-binding transcriptional LysR family regulator